MIYPTLVFDCDGVVLDSNQLKTEAFLIAASPYGTVAADALVAHHVANGGISRFAKFRHFLDAIVPDREGGPDYEALLDAYANAVRRGLRECDIAPGLERLREATAGANWLIVSGGSQEELREVFAERGMTQWFDGGIFGSPDTKDEILARELSNGNIKTPALFIGDSTYDYRAASAAGLDFVFATYWTELEGWHQFTIENDIRTINNLGEVERLAVSI